MDSVSMAGGSAVSSSSCLDATPRTFCVVCGNFAEDLVLRPSGLKCRGCIGRRSNKDFARLQKMQAARLLSVAVQQQQRDSAAMMEDAFATSTTHPPDARGGPAPKTAPPATNNNTKALRGRVESSSSISYPALPESPNSMALETRAMAGGAGKPSFNVEPSHPIAEYIQDTTCYRVAVSRAQASTSPDSTGKHADMASGRQTISCEGGSTRMSTSSNRSLSTHPNGTTPTEAVAARGGAAQVSGGHGLLSTHADPNALTATTTTTTPTNSQLGNSYSVVQPPPPAVPSSRAKLAASYNSATKLHAAAGVEAEPGAPPKRLPPGRHRTPTVLLLAPEDSTTPTNANHHNTTKAAARTPPAIPSRRLSDMSAEEGGSSTLGMTLPTRPSDRTSNEDHQSMEHRMAEEPALALKSFTTLTSTTTPDLPKPSFTALQSMSTPNNTTHNLRTEGTAWASSSGAGWPAAGSDEDDGDDVDEDSSSSSGYGDEADGARMQRSCSEHSSSRESSMSSRRGGAAALQPNRSATAKFSVTLNLRSSQHGAVGRGNDEGSEASGSQARSARRRRGAATTGASPTRPVVDIDALAVLVELPHVELPAATSSASSTTSSRAGGKRGKTRPNEPSSSLKVAHLHFDLVLLDRQSRAELYRVRRGLYADIIPAMESVKRLKLATLPPLPSKRMPSTSVASADFIEARRDETQTVLQAIVESAFLVRHPVVVQLLQLEASIESTTPNHTRGGTSTADNSFASPTRLGDSAGGLSSRALEHLRDHNTFERQESQGSATSGRSSARHHRYDLVQLEDLESVRLGSLVGRGTSGSVFMGMLHLSQGPLMVAVKKLTLNPDMPPAMLESMRHELDVLRRTHHPNVVRFLGSTYSEEKHEISFFTEYVECGTLSTMIERFGALSLLATQAYFRQILSALAYLHQLNIVHGDIKGGNVLLSKRGKVKLSDFGCSQTIGGHTAAAAAAESAGGDADAASTKPSSSSAEGTMLPTGTPLWMSPELINGAPLSQATDIWAVGCVGIEALARPLWEFPEHLHPFACLFRIARSGSAPHGLPSEEELQQLKDGGTLSAEDLTTLELYRDFLLRCLAVNPEERWSAAELQKHEFMRRPIASKRLMWPPRPIPAS